MVLEMGYMGDIGKVSVNGGVNTKRWFDVGVGVALLLLCLAMVLFVVKLRLFWGG